ncbi:hypothetical protein FAF44_50115 [Nonomuraea sp. MG754425]|uniref:hypothetical protein n=1 Tax=Nonomuraea sp. MG754425 TaxID=2570319 RepID=UPI001F3BCE71|nr:hypothetical protein [Nonomuraea sp. MG754425]MCF6476445.1 hypothetical protein [Nonomuraea sp. MG754425]
MAGTHTTGSDAALLCRPITEETAAEQNAALDHLLTHLTITGIHAELIKRQIPTRCAVKLYASGESLWHPPELVIYTDAGWRVATVSIGERSGSYMVALARVGADDEPQTGRVEVVPAILPHRAALLVAQQAAILALPEGRHGSAISG